MYGSVQKYPYTTHRGSQKFRGAGRFERRKYVEVPRSRGNGNSRGWGSNVKPHRTENPWRVGGQKNSAGGMIFSETKQ